MNTSKLKLFAQDARTILLDGVKNSLLYWGFDEEGNILERPEEIPGGCIFRGEVHNDPGVVRKWHQLLQYIKRHTVVDAREQAAYTWFNRLMALSILEHNGFENPVIVNSGGIDPPLLSDAKQGRMNFIAPTDQEKVKNLILDGNDEDAFGILLVGFCRAHPLLNRIFGGIDDFTELLLPSNLLSPGGILYLINHSEAITETDYQEVELIGWLYQFYISEKKDEVFAGFKQKKKARAEDIPAATQIFTPRWIVNYMVENTVGRIWLNHSPESPLRGEMKYLVENEDQDPTDIISSVTELKLLDPAVGSGHIMVVGLDLLLQMYKEEGYTSKTAIREILKNNLFGLDIDSRATQLACFAVLLKAAKYDPDILKEDILPQIHALPESDEFSREEILEFLGTDGEQHYKELADCLTLLQQGKNIGSALKLSLSKEARNLFLDRINDFKKNTGRLDIHLISIFIRIQPFIEVLIVMTEFYESVVTNPPYMGLNNMNSSLLKYLEDNYWPSRHDLSNVFVDSNLNLLANRGFLGMINQQSWMFSKSYVDFRRDLLKNIKFHSVIHLGAHAFPEIKGEVVQTVSFTIQKITDINNQPLFYRLVDFNSSKEKEESFLNKSPIFSSLSQKDFISLEQNKMQYGVLKPILELIKKKKFLKNNFETREGLSTGDNDRFIRYHFEISKNKIGIKWFKHVKGGEYRKWYGNLLNVVNWENNGFEIKNNKTSEGRIRSHNYNEDFIFREGFTWGSFGKDTTFRYVNEGLTFDSSGSMGFCLRDDTNGLKCVIGYLNSSITRTILEYIKGNNNAKPGHISLVPIDYDMLIKYSDLASISTDNIELAKADWDSYEISWDFQTHSFINDKLVNINETYMKWVQKVSYNFLKTHNNEEKLNSLISEIYGLQDEQCQEVLLKNITLLINEMDYSKLETVTRPFEGKIVPLKRDIVIQQFISYLIGCLMGRYRLDMMGLNIAHPNPRPQELNPYQFNDYSIEIDQDAIIPILGDVSPFSDDLSIKVRFLIEAIWGEKTLTENINFIEDALHMSLDKFLTKKFWDYHKKMYKNTPIYWLFESPKGSFRVLTYMHRMDKYTIQKIRLNYLHRYIDHLISEISRIKQTGSSNIKLEKLEDALLDCREYSDILKPFADQQIIFDLDDGVKKNYKLFEGAVKPI